LLFTDDVWSAYLRVILLSPYRLVLHRLTGDSMLLGYLVLILLANLYQQDQNWIDILSDYLVFNP